MSVRETRQPVAGLEVAFFASPIARREETEASAAEVEGELRKVGEDLRTPARVAVRTGADTTVQVAGHAGAGEAQAERPGRVFVPVPVVLTGGTEAQVLAWLDRQATAAAREGGRALAPLLLALPHSNSLPACLEILARLRTDGRGGRVAVVGRAGWSREVSAAAATARVAGFMRSARIGLFGGPSEWLAASSPDPETVRRVWGPEVVTIPLDEVVRACRAVLAEDVAGLRRQAAELMRRAEEVVEPDSGTVTGALALHQALRGLVRRHRLDAVTVRCFDLLGPVSNTGCVALSLLNDEGVTAACEGDLPALLTMMVLGRLTGRAVFMANPSDLDEAAGTVTFAHCSVPLRLVRPFRLRSHFESGVGVGIEGRFGPGVVTVARIGGRDLRQVEVFRGEVQTSGPGHREDLCRTQVTLAVGRTVVRRLLEAPLGNHHLIVPGDHVWAVLDCLERVLA